MASFKTDRLVDLFPEAYGAREGGSLLHTVLDALGAELMQADAAVKALLTSHWIHHAAGRGLDGLGAMFGVQRRLLPDGTPEGDDSFRPLVEATVPSFIGGGTVEGVQGAVRAALGLPYDLARFARQQAAAGPPGPGVLALIDGLRELVQVHEFSPRPEVMLGSAAPAAGGSRLELRLDFSTIEPRAPRIVWQFPQGARSLSIQLAGSGQGLRSRPDFALAAGQSLLLAGEGAAGFSASIGSTDVRAAFTALDGSGPPQLPQVPNGVSTWIFEAGRGAAFDGARFDDAEPYDASGFDVRLEWLRLQPLVFDVVVPYFVDAAVRRLQQLGGGAVRFTPFKGLTLDAMQQVVDRARAAGVRGMVQYAVRLPAEATPPQRFEDHAAIERFSAALEHARVELHDADEQLTTGALESEREQHDSSERFAIGAVFGVGHRFDQSFGFH